MAKHHLAFPPPPGSGAIAHTSPTSPPLASQLSLQLKQDLAKLAHNDPDTRRSSLAALKGFIEGELDTKSMSGFLEQVSGETGKSSGRYAISLFEEVARVHKQAMVPFIPRIMAVVLRTLASSSGGAGHANNLHQACAKVVAAVARYAIEPTFSATWSSSSTDVLDSLCQPLLGLLSSNVEPVAVGSATCLQAIIEAENWKLAAPELVHDVCCRSSISVVEKGKHSVAHLHLVRSLAKFNAGALQEYDGSLLNVGVHVLHATDGNTAACGSWQQRVAAAQLLGTLLGCLDQRALPSELIPTIKALECCRLDKLGKVRQAVGEALSIAKSLASQIDPLLLCESGSEVSATVLSSSHSKPPEARKRAAQKKNVWKTEESCGSTLAANDIRVGPQEPQLASHAASPSSSITTVAATSLGSRSGSRSPPSSGNSAAKSGRSPLNPAKQSPVFPPSSIDRYMSESDLPYILAHMKSADFKENAPIVAKAGDSLVSSKSDEMSYILHSSSNKVAKEVEDGADFMGHVDNKVRVTDIDGKCFMTEDCKVPEADSNSERDVSTDTWVRDFTSFSNDGACNQDGYGSCKYAPSFKGSVFEADGVESKLFGLEPDANLRKHANTVVDDCHAFSNGSVNCHDTSRSQVTKNSMTAEDFLIFSTPRRLVRSLQSVSSTPDSKCSPERDQGLDFDCETLSESGWSVRDNPIAGESEEYSPRRVSLSGGSKDMLTKSMEGSLGSYCKASCGTQGDDERTAMRFGSADNSNSTFDVSMSGLSQESAGDEPNLSMCADGLLNRYSVHRLNSSGKASCSIPSKEDDKTGSVLTQRRPRKWSSCTMVLRKAHFYAEACLFAALLVVLAFTTVIAVLRIKGQRDLHMLVPT